MKINDLLKTKTLYFIITLLIVIVLSVSSSYAFVNKNNTKLDNGLIVEYKETNSNYLYVEKSIYVKNTKNIPNEFNIYVSSLDSDSTISLDKIVYKINDGVESSLKNKNNTSIYTGKLNSNEEINLTLKFWVSYDLLENSDQGKSLSIDINVQ